MEAAVDFAVKKYSSLKTEQLEIVMAVLRGRDVFGILPTGYGKTLCFACLPFIFEQILEGEAYIYSFDCNTTCCNYEKSSKMGQPYCYR